MKKSAFLSVTSVCIFVCLCPGALDSLEQSTQATIQGESAALQLSINGPGDLAYDQSGFLYVNEIVGNKIIRFDIKQETARIIDTPPADAGKASVIAADKDGNIFIANNYGEIKKIDSHTGQIVSLQAGNRSGETIFLAIAADSHGGILGTRGNQLFRWTPEGLQTVAGSERTGFFGDGGSAREAGFDELLGVAVSAGGDIFLADSRNCRIRRIDATTQRVSTIAGSGECSSVGDDGLATIAALDYPRSLAIDREGNLYFTESSYRVRRIDKHGVISTYAGTGQRGFSGDGGFATNAELDILSGLAVDEVGNLYFADYGANRIRRVDAVTHVITTVAGDGSPKKLDEIM